MYFTEEQIQALHWRTELVNKCNPSGWILYNELQSIPDSDVEGWQWMPGNGLTLRVVKHKTRGYFLLSGVSPQFKQTPELLFKFHKLNKWGF